MGATCGEPVEPRRKNSLSGVADSFVALAKKDGEAGGEIHD